MAVDDQAVTIPPYFRLRHSDTTRQQHGAQQYRLFHVHLHVNMSTKIQTIFHFPSSQTSKMLEYQHD